MNKIQILILILWATLLIWAWNESKFPETWSFASSFVSSWALVITNGPRREDDVW